MKKQIVEVAIGELIGKGNLDAVVPWLRDDFVDHGPGIVASSKADWIAAAQKLPLTGFTIDIHRVMADGDHVTMLSRRWVPGLESWIAAVDIFRFQEGLIAEHAEVFQPIEATDAKPDPRSLVPW